MLPAAAKLAAPRLTIAGDQYVVEVPRHLATALQTHLGNNGIGATLYLERVAADARLVLWNRANASQVHLLLTRWKP